MSRPVSRKVLIVDDSATARFQTASALRGAGFEVVEAEHGDDALAKLEKVPEIFLVVADVNMPWKDGIEMLEELRASPRWAKLPVVMLTTESNAERIRRARELGITGYLTKPLQPDALVKVVTKLAA